MLQYEIEYKPENFKHMAEQLHSKVIETIYETAEAK